MPAPSGSGSNKIARDVGLGVGIPLVLVVAGVGIWLCLRPRPNPPVPEESSPPFKQPLVPVQERSRVMPTGPLPMPRRPVPSPSQTIELTGDEMHRELAGPQLNPTLPPTLPSSTVSLRGQYEMSGEGRPGELPGQGTSPPPSYFSVVTSPS